MKGQNRSRELNPFTPIRQEGSFSGDSLSLSLNGNNLKVSWSVSSLSMQSCIHFLLEEYETVHKIIRIIHATPSGEFLYKDYPIRSRTGFFLIKGLEGNSSFHGELLFFNSKNIKLTLANSNEVTTGIVKHPYRKYKWNKASSIRKWKKAFSAYTEYEGDYEK